MEENYRNIEDILENPGIFVFKLENKHDHKNST